MSRSSAKCSDGSSSNGGNAHQAANRQTQIIDTGSNEGVAFLGHDTGFLRFRAGVHLNETVTPKPGRFHDPGKHLRQFRTIDGFDYIEQRDRGLNLVGLQRPDQVQFEIGAPLAQRRPFGFGFLDPVFAENPLSRRDHPGNGGRRHGLADGDQGDGSRIPARRVRGGGDIRLHRLQVRRHIDRF